MFEIPPLLIAFGIDDLLTYLAPFVFLIVWVVSQIMEAKKKGEQPLPKPQTVNPPPPREQATPPAPPQAQGPGGAGGASADSLREQVDEFLRRAGRDEKAPEPRESKQRARPPKSNEIEILLDDEAAAPRRERLAEPLRPMKGATSALRPISVKPGHSKAPRRVPSLERDAERVELSAQGIEETASHLGQRIVREDAQFDFELQSRFDHQVGTFGALRETPSAQSTTAPSADTPAAQIAELLASPQGIRQAIVLNEILRRPVDRW